MQANKNHTHLVFIPRANRKPFDSTRAPSISCSKSPALRLSRLFNFAFRPAQASQPVDGCLPFVSSTTDGPVRHLQAATSSCFVRSLMADLGGATSGVWVRCWWRFRVQSA